MRLVYEYSPYKPSALDTVKSYVVGLLELVSIMVICVGLLVLVELL